MSCSAPLLRPFQLDPGLRRGGTLIDLNIYPTCFGTHGIAIQNYRSGGIVDAGLKVRHD